MSLDRQLIFIIVTIHEGSEKHRNTFVRKFVSKRNYRRINYYRECK